jgi:hypothetical protein
MNKHILIITFFLFFSSLVYAKDDQITINGNNTRICSGDFCRIEGEYIDQRTRKEIKITKRISIDGDHTRICTGEKCYIEGPNDIEAE